MFCFMLLHIEAKINFTCMSEADYFAGDQWKTNCNPFAYRVVGGRRDETKELLKTDQTILHYQNFAPPWETQKNGISALSISLFEITDKITYGPSGTGACGSDFTPVFYTKAQLPLGYSPGFERQCEFLVGKPSCCMHAYSDDPDFYPDFDEYFKGQQYSVYPRCYNLLHKYPCMVCHENLTGFMFLNGENYSLNNPLASFRMCEDYAEAVYRECRHAYWRVGTNDPIRIVPEGYTLTDFKRLNGLELFDNGTVKYEYEAGSTCISFSSGFVPKSSLILMLFSAIITFIGLSI